MPDRFERWPIKFAFGNVAYSIGVGGGVIGGLKAMTRGEVPQYSSIQSHTTSRFRAHNAGRKGCRRQLGRRYSDVHYSFSRNSGDGDARYGLISLRVTSWIRRLEAATSDLTNQEMWNLIHMGYMPMQLVLGVSVYALGIVGGVTAAFRHLAEVRYLNSHH